MLILLREKQMKNEVATMMQTRRWHGLPTVPQQGAPLSEGEGSKPGRSPSGRGEQTPTLLGVTLRGGQDVELLG